MENHTLKIKGFQRNKGLLILVALFSVYLFWGGTYLGIKIAIETMPPFIMAGIRFISAGLILYLWARLSGTSRPNKRQWLGAVIVGVLLLLGGNGLVVWAEQLVPSGIAAILIATVPLWIIILEWMGKSQKRPNNGVIIGVLLGFAGIVVLVVNSIGMPDKNSIHPVGVVALLFAALSWSLGSLYSRIVDQPDSPLLSTAMQMLVGGALLLAASLFFGEWARFDIMEISFRSYIALGYLIIFGSIVGYNAYIWLLKNAEPAWVSTYAFVNPVVAVFVGWLIAGEQLTINTLIAAAIIITSVVIITFYRNRTA